MSSGTCLSFPAGDASCGSAVRSGRWAASREGDLGAGGLGFGSAPLFVSRMIKRRVRFPLGPLPYPGAKLLLSVVMARVHWLRSLGVNITVLLGCSARGAFMCVNQPSLVTRGSY